MLIQPIDYFLAFWFAIAAASTLYVGFDQYRNNPEPVVMKWGFILVTLYMGPLGLLLYVLADKEPRPGEHEAFTRPLWKQGVGSTIHCVAGDATGIILAAVITATLGLPMWLDLIVEYLAGFAFGLFIFQSLFMKSMMGGTYWENVRKSFLPEFVSMNFMMAGMAPVMSFLMMGRDMRAMEPTELLFWGVMSIGVIAGFTLAYPANVWLVARKLKHGLMTQRPQAVKPDQETRHAHDGASDMAEEGHAGHTGKAAPAKAQARASHAAHPAQQGGHSSHAAHGSGGHRMETDATTPQIASLSVVSLIALAIGMMAPANWLNLTLSAREVGGAIMPPGMIMDRDTPAAAMRDMAAVDPRLVSFKADPAAQGGAVLEPRIENGVKVFDLEASVIRWSILPGVEVEAFAYNKQVPGPTLRVTQGDRVRINVTNRLPESTTVHWHGLDVPNAMDGPAYVTQKPIEPGETFSYEYTVEQSGTYFYHTHDHVDRQQALGLYGALIIDPKNPADAITADLEYTVQLQEWLKREGLTFPSMPMDGGFPNFFTINGKSYPATETINMKVGQLLKIRFVGSNTTAIHPMHIHGGPFQVVAVDGATLPQTARYTADTVNVGPGQRFDVLWRALRPGKWLLHCHIPHHTTNNNVEEKGGGGLTMVIDVN
ncbi:MAG: multicopper oxidase domain-containing protein [Phyllobacterium sp.]|jgi:FtsP/CotA-like multicopper oxidase with cupredoxin domain|uniref:multicopper oxidase domain-containing protein n=1 Tax=Mesorhizobium sp. 65-26 TaxID=1895781 RepID=UPI0009674679|nr:multicopper oxidase domain-containing protein [Mesorhizobium sp. 65-26]MBN9138520.1 multicopper oxidase domain-containing protein [Phyllobacterium sp.]OJX76852.1 MAG: copper oxidase [Mesorhizobium sp. 65-26]